VRHYESAMWSRCLNVQIVGRARVFLAAIALTAMTGCGIAHPSELNFRSDKRLTFTTPEARTLVKPPLTVAWTIRDFQVRSFGSAPPSKDAGYFAVFVDRAPIKPSETMRDVAHDDQECLHRPGCPDTEYLAERLIYQTTKETITIPQIPPIAGDSEKVQLHTITVALMDTTGHRIGESAWQLDLRMRKVGV
jgi:hypothetical protein